MAIPGLEPVAVTGADPADGFELARIVDSSDLRWMVKAPLSDLAGAAMEGEVALLENLAEVIDSGALPFDVPRPRGFAPLPEGGRAVVYPELPGAPITPELLDRGVVAEIARAIATLHSLPTEVVEETGLPAYSAAECRERLLSEIDEAAATGHVPGSLLQRWEEACEDVRLWRFVPTVVHGDLVPEHVLIRETQVVGVTEWSSARVGDPADDLAPLLAAAPEVAMDTLVDSYHEARGVGDDRVLARSVLASEMALLRWLMHGVHSGDSSIVSDAIGMLTDLADGCDGADPIAAIGVEPPPEPTEQPPAPAAPTSPAGPAGRPADDAEGRSPEDEETVELPPLQPRGDEES